MHNKHTSGIIDSFVNDVLKDSFESFPDADIKYLNFHLDDYQCIPCYNDSLGRDFISIYLKAYKQAK